MLNLLFLGLLYTNAPVVRGFEAVGNTRMNRLPQQTIHNDAVSPLRSSLLEDSVPAGGVIGRSPSDIKIELPPLIQSMADERREFDMNLGKAMDVLRKDYPNMLHTTPDFSIYNDDISVLDPSGVQLSGLGNYKNSFSFLQTMIGFFYNMEQSGVQNRMMYDFARQSIRISWNAVLVPKVLGNRRSLYIDGISIYRMDSKTGKIGEHRVEKMLINDIPVTPPYGVLSALKNEILYPSAQGVPAGVGLGAMIELS